MNSPTEVFVRDVYEKKNTDIVANFSGLVIYWRVVDPSGQEFSHYLSDRPTFLNRTAHDHPRNKASPRLWYVSILYFTFDLQSGPCLGNEQHINIRTDTHFLFHLKSQHQAGQQHGPLSMADTAKSWERATQS